MTNSLIAVLAAAFCACASSPVDSVKPSIHVDQAIVLRSFPLGDGANLRKPLLKAAGTDRTTEPGKIRVPIAVDGVLYEVVVAKPGMGTMVPLSPP